MFSKNTIFKAHSIVIMLTLLMMAFSTIGVTRAYAAAIVVTTSADVGPGSLRQAIAGAPNGSTITFHSSLSGATIYLTSALQTDKQLTINGSSLASRITISGDSDANGAGNVQVFYLLTGARITLDSLIITKGWSNTVGGGIISFYSELIIKNSTLINNHAVNFGGGIYNQSSTILLINSTISGNSSDLYSGGGIFNADGIVSINNCIISNNFSAGGGGINNESIMDISDSTISNNIALLDGGGGINNNGTLTVTNTTLSGNSSNRGGGINNMSIGSLLTVTNSTLTGNYAFTNGGGIFNGNGNTNIGNSTLNNNIAEEGGAGIYNASMLIVTDSALSGNHADNGGGIYNYRSLIIVNSTISGNLSYTDGGGIYNISSTANANVYNSSIVYNAADSDADINGGLGGGVYNHVSLAVFNLRNSLVAGNSVSGAPIYDDCYGILNSYGRNLIGALSTTTSGSCTVNTSTGNWTQLNDLNLLGSFQNNGGPTATIALLPGNNAIDGGDPTFGCTDQNGNIIFADQRGVNRLKGSHCDIGAFEYVTPTILTLISNATSDGQILETSETSGKGGTIDSTATRINLGDDAANKQYRAILSFDTSSLPDNAVITSVTLKVKYAGKGGTLPFSTHGNLLADIRKGPFSNNGTLQTNDFKAAASKNSVLSFTNSMVSNWFSQSLAPANFQYINLTNVTQFRLRFQTDDNHDFGADLLKVFSSNAGASGRPKLIIEYYIP